MKAIFKFSTLILTLSLGFSAFASSSISIPISNSNAGDPGVLSVASAVPTKNSAGYNDFSSCSPSGNSANCNVFSPFYFGAGLAVAVNYVPVNAIPVSVGTFNYTVVDASGSFSVSFTPANPPPSPTVVTCAYNGPNSISESTPATQLTCTEPTPWAPTWAAFTPAISFSPANGVTYSLAPPSVSSLSANWGNFSGTNNLEGNTIVLTGSTSVYNLAFSLLSNGSGLNAISGSTGFNLNFVSNNGSGSNVSVPVTFSDNNGTFNLATASGANSFNIDPYNSCSIGSANGSGNLTLNCSYISHIQAYNFPIGVTGAADLILGSAAVAGNPAWATNVSGGSFASGNYNLSYSADSVAYPNQAGDFSVNFPVSAGSSGSSQNIYLDVNKAAGSSNLTLNLGQGTPANFTLQNSSTNMTYSCAPAIASNALNLNCKTSNTRQAYAYTVNVNSGLSSGATLGSATVTGTPSDWSGAPSSILFLSNAYNYSFTAAINGYSNDAGTPTLTIPVIYNGAPTGANLVYTITKESGVLQPVANVSVTGGDSSSTFTVPTSDPAVNQSCSVSLSSATNDSGNYSLPLNISCSNVNLPNDNFSYTVTTTVNGAPNSAGLNTTATISAPNWAISAPNSVSSSAGVYTVPFSVSHGHFTNDSGNISLTLTTGDSSNTSVVMNLAKVQGNATLTPSLSSGATFNYTDANNNIYSCTAVFTADPNSATDYLLNVKCIDTTITSSYTVSLNAAPYSFQANDQSNLGATFTGATVSTPILPSYSGGAYSYTVSYNAATPSSSLVNFPLTFNGTATKYFIAAKFNGGSAESMSIDPSSSLPPGISLSSCSVSGTGNFTINCSIGTLTADIDLANNFAPSTTLVIPSITVNAGGSSGAFKGNNPTPAPDFGVTNAAGVLSYANGSPNATLVFTGVFVTHTPWGDVSMPITLTWDLSNGFPGTVAVTSTTNPGEAARMQATATLQSNGDYLINLESK